MNHFLVIMPSERLSERVCRIEESRLRQTFAGWESLLAWLDRCVPGDVLVTGPRNIGMTVVCCNGVVYEAQTMLCEVAQGEA